VSALTSSLIALPTSSIVGGTGSFDVTIIPSTKVFYDADLILNFPN